MKKEITMINRITRQKFIALIGTIILCLSGVSSVSATEGEADAAVASAENTITDAEQTEENAEDEEEPERLEPDAYFEPIQSDQTEGWPAGPAVWAESAVVMDMDSGTFLYSKNMDVVKYPASITKIMTTFLAIENSGPNERVTFSENAIYGIERNSSHIGIRVGEILSMKECWYGMMLESANEVCLAVAEHIGGSVDGFVELMNQKAAELGCTNTHFTNPNGLPDENHYTTAHDMALIAQAAYANKTFRQLCQTQYYCIPTTNVCGEKRWLSNHHKMLPEGIYAYEGCTGGKTGFTQAALNTLVTYAERDGRRLVCVSLRTNGAQIYADTASLLDYGFQNFQNITVFSRSNCPGTHMLCPSLYSGKPSTIDVLRPTTVITIPVTATQDQVATGFSQDDVNLYHTYLYNQYPVGKEALPKTGFYEQLTTFSGQMPETLDNKITSETISDPESKPDFYHKILEKISPLTTILKKVPVYIYVLAGILLLLIIMEIVLLIKRKKRRKRKKRK